MPQYAAFLRGINLGPKRRIGADELRAAFEDVGLRDVGTFRSSGNVIFTAGRDSVGKLTSRIEAGLVSAHGFDVTVFLRTAAEVRSVAAKRPFASKVVTASKGKLQVVFLPQKPAAGARKEVLALASDEDRLAFGERELYWLPSAGIRDAALDLKTVDKLIGPTTMRTMGTVEQVATKYFPA
jgi:uncharacterized protein (DUF1697 family)